MRAQRGFNLIELVFFIVIVSIAFTAMVAIFNQFNSASADPLIRKQALAIAESLLEEIELMPFTFCDPDDANAATATSAAACATLVEALGPEGETRYSTAAPFDNVNDYDGFTLPKPPGILDIAGSAVPGLANYSASVTVSQAGLGAIAAADALLITVTVTPPSGTAIVLQGYRTRYAPRTAQ